jgi:hypothetical protein
MGDVVTINMNATSGSLDPFLILLSPAGDELVRNDDAQPGVSLDAGIIEFTIPADGAYTIIATRFREESGPSEGGFQLSLEANAEISDSRRMNYGDTVRGVIEGDTFELEYTFEAQAGEVVDIQMTKISGNLDPFIIVRGADGAEIDSNDDDPQGGGSLDSYLHELSIPANGMYTIVATRFNGELGDSTGEFELALRFVRNGP